MKIAFSGTHGTGKTTSVYEHAYKLKLKYPNKKIIVLTEVAAECPLPINTDAKYESQLWIFNTQIKREIELSSKYDIVICDRTIVDNLAYSKLNGFHDLYESTLKLAVNYIESYSHIKVKLLKNNDHLHEDGIRDAKNIKFREDVEKIMVDTYNVLKSLGSEFKLEYV